MRPDKRVFICIFEDKYLGLDHKEKAGWYLAGDRPHSDVAKEGGSNTKRKLFDVIEVHNIEHEREQGGRQGVERSKGKG